MKTSQGGERVRGSTCFACARGTLTACDRMEREKCFHFSAAWDFRFWRWWRRRMREIFFFGPTDQRSSLPEEQRLHDMRCCVAVAGCGSCSNRVGSQVCKSAGDSKGKTGDSNKHARGRWNRMEL
jgi:hypothetical protein